MSTRGLERNRVAKTMKDISLMANQRAGARKPQIHGIPATLSYPRCLEESDINDRSVWNSKYESVINHRMIDYQKPRNNVRAKRLDEKKKKKSNAVDGLNDSMRKLSLNKPIFPTAIQADFLWYVERYLVAWVKLVIAQVEGGKEGKERERAYHEKMRDLLKSKGFDVGYEVHLKYERKGLQQPIVKVADLIVSMPNEVQKILIECKAKKKLKKADYEQVKVYHTHFGIPICYLINFHTGEVKKLNPLTNEFVVVK